jgi:hypothetical protein
MSGTQSQTFRSSVTPLTEQQIYTVTSPVTPGTQFSQALPNGTKKLLIKCNQMAEIRFTLTNGETATNSVIIPRGTVYEAVNLNLNGKTAYFECNQSSKDVMIEIWL